MTGDRIALAAADPAALARAAEILAARGAEVLARCANLAELTDTVHAAPPDFALVDAALCPDQAARAVLARDLGLPVLPLAWLVTEAATPAVHSRSSLARAEDAAAAGARHLSDQRLRMIFEHVPLGVALVGNDGSIRAVNPEVCRMMAYDAAKLCTMNVLDITYVDDRGLVRDAVGRLLRGETESFRLEERNVDSAGRVFWVRATVVPIRDERGELLHRLALIEDIDAQRNAEVQARVQAVAQRNALVREVHHRIKNNLQAVVGLLRRQLGAHPELAGPLDAAISQVNTMAIVHGLQGRLPNEAVRLIDLLAGIGVAAENVVERAVVLPSLAGLSELELAAEEAVPIAMVLNELLLNALRHGRVGPAIAPVQVRVLRLDPEVTVQIENAFDDPGGPLAQTGPAQGGLKLVQALLPAQGATLRWLRKEPGIMVAELVLSPPVLQYDSNRNSGRESAS